MVMCMKVAWGVSVCRGRIINFSVTYLGGGVEKTSDETGGRKNFGDSNKNVS